MGTINETTIYFVGVLTGLAISMAVLKFCRYKNWIRDTTNKERYSHNKAKESQ